MHEISICQSLMRIIDESLRAGTAARVKKVRLEIGALAAVEPHALRFGFDVVSRGTLAEGSELEIAVVPGKAWCIQCTAEREIVRYGSHCPVCDGMMLPRGGGDMLRVKELEVE